MPTHSTLKNNSSSSLIESASNNIVPQNDENITEENKTDKITIEDMLKGVEDPDGKIYFQDEQGNFFRNDMDGRYRGNQDNIDALYKGEYVPFHKVIKIFESGDESTIIHEFAHWYLDTLDKYASENEEIADDMETVRKFLKCGADSATASQFAPSSRNGGKFTVAQHEKFARAFEVYIRNGYAQNNKLKKVFEYFKNALLSIYDNLRKISWQNEDGTEGTFTADDVPAINNLFNTLLTSERERIKNT